MAQMSNQKLAGLFLGGMVLVAFVVLGLTGNLPFGQQPLAITGDNGQPTGASPTGEGTVLKTEEACGDGKPDILSRASYVDYSFSPERETQVATNYRIFLNDAKNPAYSGVGSASADTSTADAAACGDSAKLITGNSAPNGGYYFAEVNSKLDKSKNLMYGMSAPTGDLQTITFNSPNATGANFATLAMDTAGGVSSGQIKVILHLNSTSGTFGYHNAENTGILMISEWEKGNFSDVKPAAKEGWTISLGTVPSNYTVITSGLNTQAWIIKGIKINPQNTEVEIPLFIKAADNTNPGNAATGGQWTPISLTFYDLSTDLVDGKLVYEYVNQSGKQFDIGSPNRASAVSNTTGIHIQ